MGAKDRSGKAGQTRWTTQGERVVQRLLEDRELRSSLLGAAASARSAYGRLNNGKGPTQALFEDSKLQKELIDTANALRNVSMSLSGAPPRRRRRHRGRRTLGLLLVGGILAVALSSDLRSKVLDMLFGAEEEFDYTSTTAPPMPAPASVAGG